MVDCTLSERERQCDGTRCQSCGFNPVVKVKRLAAMAEKAKSAKPAFQDRPVYISEALSIVRGRLRDAETRLAEENLNGEELDVRYWKAHVDGMKSVLTAMLNAWKDGET